MKRSASSALGNHLLLALVLAAVFPLRGILIGQELPYLADAIHQHYPGQAVISRQLAAAPRALPTWDAYQFCGSPLLADPVRQAYYPPTLLYRLLPFPQAYGLLLAGHVLLALAGMAALLVFTGLGARGAMLGAIGFGLGVHMALLQSAPPVLCACAWLPWIALFALRAARGDLRGGALGLAVCGGWLLLAGSPAVALSAVVLTAVVVATEAGDRRRQVASASALGWAGGALAAAALLAPYLAVLSGSAHGGLPVMGLPGADAIAPWDLLGIIAPKAFLVTSRNILNDPTVHWATLHAPGILILALAASGWWLRRGDRSVRTPLRLLGLGLALGLGSWLPILGRLELLVWPFSRLPHPGLWMEIGSVGLAWLAGIGAHELEARSASPAGRRVREGWLVGAVFLASIGFGSHLWELGAPGKFIESRWGAAAIAAAGRMGVAMDAAVLLVIGAVFLWLASRREISAAWAIRVIGVLAFLETGLGVGLAAQPRLPAAGLLAPSATERALAAELPAGRWGRVFVTPHHQIVRAEEGEGRAELAGRWRASLRSNLPAAAGFRDASGDNVLRPAGTNALLESVTHAPHTPWDPAARRVFDALGVRLLITRSLIQGHGMEVALDGHARVFRRERSLRPAWVQPDDAGVVASAVSGRAGEWTVRVRLDRPATLVVSESGSNGWRIRTGPAGAKLRAPLPEAQVKLPIDALLAVDLPAGAQTVTLVYDPPAVRIGLGLSLLAAVLLGVLGIRRTPTTRA